MKRIDYYAVHNPWRMPKWLGVALGGIFGVIAVGSMIAIVQLTKGSEPPMTALAAAPLLSSSTAMAPTAAPEVKTVTAAPKASAPLARADAPMRAHAAKHKAKKHALARLASAKRSSSGLDSQKRATILAKHDSKDKRLEKDALDKLLGL